MRVSILDGNTRRDIHVERVSHLGHIVAPRNTGVLVDGEPVTVDMPIAESGLRTGSVIELDSQVQTHRRALAELHGVVGNVAGDVLGLVAGRYVVGPGGDIDIPDCEVTMDVLSTGEVQVDGAPVTGFLQLGTTGWVIKPAASRTRRQPGPHLRPPRPRPSVNLQTFTAPRLDPPAPVEKRFRWVLMLGPIIMGAGMAIMISPRMAWMAAMSPVLMLGSWLDGRWQGKRADKAFAQAIRDARSVLKSALRNRRDIERTRELADRLTPDAACEIARTEDPRLWERRPDHEDAFLVSLGYAVQAWDVPVEPGFSHELQDVIDAQRAAGLGVLPLLVDLAPGAALGVAGPGSHTVPLVRSLILQAATAHGPADIRTAVLTDDPELWTCMKWLPHTQSRTGEWLVGTSSQSTRLLADISNQAAHTPVMLVVDVELTPDLVNALRALTSDVTLLVIAGNVRSLPSLCAATVKLSQSEAQYRAAQDSDEQAFSASGVSELTAERTARALAAVVDPEAVGASGSLPDAVSLVGLLGPISADAMVRSWSAQPYEVVAPLGMTEDGPLMIDLVHDGPHALLAGTTGAGKSELLRTLVASLAYSVHPSELNFVLIDYKGGSAFDVCTELPHVVGSVTDLDPHLGDRARISLEAELHHREVLLRAAGASDISAYQQSGGTELPRLFIVVDEFAAMTTDLPDFVDCLVDIAQRGRSLGVHVLLATQRPAGIIKDNIRANTNLRLSLRVQSDADSKDVIESNEAAGLPRNRPGRGLVRKGPDETIAFQTAMVSGASASSVQTQIRPFLFSPEQPARDQAVECEGPTDLERLVAASKAAAASLEISPQRCPWLEPLPDSIHASDIAGVESDKATLVPLGLADNPQEQSQPGFGWSVSDGHVIAYGPASSGTSELLSTFVLSAAAECEPGAFHAYVLDHGTRGYGDLAELPHVGAVVSADDAERQKRVLARLSDELERRRAGGSGQVTALVVDNLPALLTSLDSGPGWAYRNLLEKLLADGSGLGLFVVATSPQATGLSSRYSSLIPTKYVFALADPTDVSLLGLRASEVPALPTGRAVDVSSGLVVQFMHCDPSAVRPAEGGPLPVETLASQIKRSELAERCETVDGLLRIPIGVASETLATASWELYEDDHIVVGGGIRTGRSTTLVSIAEALSESPEPVLSVAVSLRRSPLRDVATVDELITTEEGLVEFLDRLAPDTSRRRTVILIDDAESVADPGGRLEAFLAARRPNLHVVAAVRTDGTPGYGHWTKTMCAGRVGLLLDPAPHHGELLGVSVPKGTAVGIAGRGLLVAHGRSMLTQVAHP